MKFGKNKNTEILEGDLTPMIDMTFQLIAFFMLLINFTEVDQAADILLPKSVLAVPPEERPKYQIILNLEEQGKVIFAGGEPEEIGTIGVLLQQEVNSARRERTSPDEIAVIIRAHQVTKSGKVQELIAKCQENDLVNFKLRVKDEAF